MLLQTCAGRNHSPLWSVIRVLVLDYYLKGTSPLKILWSVLTSRAHFWISLIIRSFSTPANTRPVDLRLWKGDSRWEEARVPPSANNIWNIWQDTRIRPHKYIKTHWHIGVYIFPLYIPKYIIDFLVCLNLPLIIFILSADSRLSCSRLWIFQCDFFQLSFIFWSHFGFVSSQPLNSDIYKLQYV